VTPVSSGSKSVYVSKTTTYTLTAKGSGGTVSCRTTVTITSNPAPTCTLSANPSSLNGPGDSTLTWNTSNATSVSIDQGVGSVNLDGSKQVHLTQTTTYTLTAKGSGGTVTCHTVVTVKTNQKGPTCTLSANPDQINKGDNSTLSWTTTNADTFSINQGIGQVTPVDKGSVKVSPTQTITYTGTAKGAGGTVTCSATITVTTVQNGPTCTLSAHPQNIKPGDSSTLTWDTKNADTVSIDHGIGNVKDSGDQKVSPKNDTTYTLTAKGKGGTVTCQTTITVSNNPGPSCTLDVNPDNIDKGDNATLKWTTDNATSFSIDHGIGNVHPVDQGSEKVSPNDDTTYTGTATAKDGRTATCRASLDVGNNNHGGGGHSGGGDNVTLTGTPTQSQSYVYLSQIPYTGLDLGPVGTVVYWLMLVLWSLGLSYLFLFKLIPFVKGGAVAFGQNVHVALNTDTHGGHGPSAHTPYAGNVEDIHIPNTEPIMESTLAMPSRGYSTYDGFRSFATGGALSIDDIVKGLSRQPAPAEPVHEAPAPIAPAIAEAVEAPATPMNFADEAPAIHRAADTNVRGFIAALIDGDRTAVFGTLRTIAKGGGSSQTFLTDAVSALDDAYRARIDGTPVDPAVASILAATMTPTLERLIAALATAVDSSYSHDSTAAKLALTRAFAVIGK